MGKSGKRKKKGLLIFFCCAAVLFVLFALAVFLTVTHDWNDPVEPYNRQTADALMQNPYIADYGKTMVSAHRSGGGIFPENTMMAFQGCIESDSFRTDVFEFDLHITKDGELILLHDDTLDRTTDCEETFGVTDARPENFSLAELRQLNFGEGFTDANGNMPYRGLRGDAIPESLRVATLGDVLNYLEDNGGFRYIIEIKNHKDLGCQAADALYAELKNRGLLDKAIVGTFNGEVTAYLDAAYPDMLRSAGIAEVLGFYLDATFGIRRDGRQYAFAALQIPANQFVIKLGTTRLVNYAHKHNVAVQYWTINNADDIRMLRDIGADCVMSDVPDLAYDVIHTK